MAGDTGYPRLSDSEVAALVEGRHASPHEVLGPHPTDDGVIVRVLRPSASGVWLVLPDGSRIQMAHEAGGIWSTFLDDPTVPDYRLAVSYDHGDPIPADDPYRFLPTVRELDLHLISEGRHEELWKVLGSRVHEYDSQFGPVRGVSFAVWAPNAMGVRVVGDFNYWDGTSAPMRSLGSSGVWELFVPEIGPGNHYKFEILGPDGQWRLKADPMARQTEALPAGASIVTSSTYAWGDDAWLRRRTESDPHLGPMSIMEVHLGSWRQGLSYVELAEQLTEYADLMGYTHVELLPVMEHPFGGSWGYQVTSYYAPTARFGTPDEFRYLVDSLHRAGIGVILDWVPGHFPKDDWALARFDGTPLYEHADPRRGEQLDWGTYVFDFGRPEVRNFLVANAIYWAREFHIDGIRVDAVASMLYLDYSREPGEWAPNIYGGRENLEAVQFLQEMNATVYRLCPGVVTIAEESTAWPGVTRATHLGGLGFGMKWNMGWMHDSLGYMGHDAIHRRFHHHEMTFSLMYAWSEQYVLPVSHDEVVHGKGSLINKMAGDHDAKFANLRSFLAYMWAHPGKQLLFMGQEFAQWQEWSEERSLDWYLVDEPHHLGVQRVVQRLNEVYQSQPALWDQDFTPDGFEWIDANDADNNVFSFVRWSSEGTPLVCVSNFAGIHHGEYRVGLPWGGPWVEILNTDAIEYGGHGGGNLGLVHAWDDPWHGRPASATLMLPALSTVWLIPAPPEPEPESPERRVLGR